VNDLRQMILVFNFNDIEYVSPLRRSATPRPENLS